MKVLVAIKRVLDFNVNVRIKADQSDVDLSNLKMSINPFDEIAVEEALRLKEKSDVNEIIVVSIGPQACQETLRVALALGADRAIHVLHDATVEPLNIAHMLKALVEKESPQLVFLGKQSIDGDHNQTGQMLAALLDWPQATFASEVVLSEKHIEVTREVDGGLETLRCQLPAIMTTDLRLNEPRYASLPNIMKAKKKPLDILSIDDLNITLKQHVTTLKVTPPAKREAGLLVENISALVDKLRQEAKVI